MIKIKSTIKQAYKSKIKSNLTILFLVGVNVKEFRYEEKGIC